jgi:thiol-disulfide isomerase/thioredoxin
VSRRTRDWLLILLVGVAAAAAGYAYHAWRTAPAAPSSDGLSRLLSAEFPDLGGHPQTLRQWSGQVLVVNFWATWCAPCREEIPLFVRLQQAHGARGLQFVGIAIDQPENVRAFAAEFNMNFPVLIGGLDAIDRARALGNKAGVLPFTVVIGRDGVLVSTETGAVKEGAFAPFLLGLL